MSQLIFTRYLYSVDEVIHTLLLCLLEKKSFQKCLFWISELYYSKFYQLTWNFIYQTYYDFYAITNPKFEKYIYKCNKKWINKNEILHIINAINVLYYATDISNIVFKLRISKINSPKKIYLKSPKWIKKLNLSKKEQVFIQSLDNKHQNDTAFYFSQIPDIKRCEFIIKEYMELKLEALVGPGLHANSLYQNIQHMTLSTICWIMNTSYKVNKRLIKKKIKQDDLNFIETANLPANKISHTLTEKRKFSIEPGIGFFNNNRIQNYPEALWYKWEYYARKCPLWCERFKKYNCRFDIDKEPVFPDDGLEDFCEDFYEEFGYEPDEQSKECQMKSLEPLDKKNTIYLLEGFENKTYIQR